MGASGLGGWRAVRPRQGQPKGSKLDAQRDYLLGLVEATTDITLKKMQAQLRGKGRGGRDRHAVTLLPGPGLHGKETAHAAEQDRADVLARREAWFEGQLDLDPAKLVFIDETKFGAARRAFRPRWRARAAGLLGGSGCGLEFLTVIGGRPSSAP